VFPGKEWSIPAGVWANFSVYSTADNCSVPLCQNNAPAEPDPTVCSFTHGPEETAFFILVTPPRAASPDLEATFSVKSVEKPQALVKSGAKPSPQALATRNIKNAQCPAAKDVFSQLRAFVRTEGPISVVNVGSDYTQWAQFEVPICLNFDNGFLFSLQATDTSSAFSSFLCSTAPCNAGSVWDGGFDASGSALNSVEWKNPVKEPFILTVAGYGRGKQASTCTFAFTPL